ncbi:hypothetical protein AN901_203909 [Pseudomonas syringae pv. theae]|nr:hypothetical protein AN901_203909 [Pseudomonas syringae pv. theae]
MQRVEQLLELIVGDVIASGGWCSYRRDRFDHWFRLGSGNLVGRLRLGQASQRRQQFRRRRSHVSPFTYLTEHAVDRVQSFQDHIHQFGINAPLTLTKDVEHVLGDVAALHQLMELEEAGAAFYSVKTAKNCIEQISIIRSAFQLDQLF